MKNSTIKWLRSEIKAVKQNSKLRYFSVEKATILAKNETDARLTSMNEWRGSLKDAQSNFVQKAEYNSEILRLQDDVKTLRESRAEAQGKASQSSVYIAYLIALLSLVISAIAIFIK
jgi:hypothetical protein